MEFNNYKVDSAKSEDGVWMEHDGAQFLIARFGNIKFVNYLEKLRRPYERVISNGTISNDKLTEIGCRAIAKYILLDWKGLTVNGKEVPYSEDKAFELLIMPNAEEFRNLISNLSQDVEQYREDSVSKLEKKSATS